MTILVTGCAGFIGSKVASQLLDMGHTVLGVDSLAQVQHNRLQEWRLAALHQHPSFTFRRVDISDFSQLKPIFGGDGREDQVSAVINLGALAGVRGSTAAPRAYYETNVLGDLEPVGIMPGVWRRPVRSSVNIKRLRRRNGGPHQRRRPFQPASVALRSFQGRGRVLAAFLPPSLWHGCAAVLRYFTVYGPAGRPDMSIFRFIRSVCEDEPITVFGDGMQQRDFTYVDDVARGTVAALGITGYETINLGHGTPVTLADVIKLIERAVGKQARIIYQDRHPADPMTTWADINRAQSLLGWNPTVGIEEGIGRSVKWYLENRDWAKGLT